MTDRQDRINFLEKVNEQHRKTITRTRNANLEKPLGLTWTKWRAPVCLRETHRMAAIAAANGATNKQLSEEFGWGNRRVIEIRRSPAFQAEIERVRQDVIEMTIKGRLDKILPKAVDVAEEILDDDEAPQKLRADVAFKFMERVLGKPSQEIQHTSNTIERLFDALDKPDPYSPDRLLDEKPVIDVDVTPKMEENVPKEVKKEEDTFDLIQNWSFKEETDGEKDSGRVSETTEDE